MGLFCMIPVTGQILNLQHYRRLFDDGTIMWIRLDTERRETAKVADHKQRTKLLCLCCGSVVGCFDWVRKGLYTVFAKGPIRV